MCPEATRDAAAAGPSLLTLEQVADVLGVRVKTVRDYIRERGLPAVVLSSKVVRVNVADLESWLDSHVVQIPPQEGRRTTRRSPGSSVKERSN